jgi:hypothetical protein
MKNALKLLSIAALIAITGFTMIACIKSGEDGSTSGNVPIFGPETIVYITSEVSLTIRHTPFILI